MTDGGILALDLASQLGWAHAAPGAIEAWPMTALEAVGMPPPHEVGHKRIAGSGAALGGFFDRYHDWLVGKIDLLAPARLVYEAQHVSPKADKQMCRKLFGLAGHTEWVCRRLGVPCEEAEPRDVRLHFMGVGSGKRARLKALAIAACKARGWPCANDDEADATAILDYAVAVVRRRMVAERVAA